MDLDDLQDDLKGLSKYQCAVILAIGLNMVPSIVTSNSGAFLSAVPEHR